MSLLTRPRQAAKAAARNRGSRIGPATGPQHGAAQGSDPALRLWLLGESTAAGVGAPTHDSGLGGALGRAVAQRTGRTVLWNVAAKSGATARTAADQLVPALPAETDADRPSLIVVFLGVNDLVRATSLQTWQDDLTALIAAISVRTGSAPLVFAGVPPVHQFPALPALVQPILRRRVKRFDQALARTATAHGARHQPTLDLPDDASLFAADGFHPSPRLYSLWADQLADRCGRTLEQPNAPARTNG